MPSVHFNIYIYIYIFFLLLVPSEPFVIFSVHLEIAYLAFLLKVY